MDRGSEDTPGGSGVPPAGPHIDVPDDARELARDVEAWRREQRWERRRLTLERRFLGGPRQGTAMSAPLVIAVLLALAMLAATIASSGRSPARTPTAPVSLLLAAPGVAQGLVGGLVPDVTLKATTGTTSARDLRPAVFAIVQRGCGCDAALARVADQAAGYGLKVYLVGTVAQQTELQTLIDQLKRSDLQLMVESAATASVPTLTAGWSHAGLTVVAVHADGVIGAIAASFSRTASLDAVFAGLKQPAHAGA